VTSAAAAALRGDTFCNSRRGKNGNENAAEMAEISSRASVDARTKRNPAHLENRLQVVIIIAAFEIARTRVHECAPLTAR